MRSFFYSVLGSFLTPGGLILWARLTRRSSSSPLGIDFAVIVLSARHPHLFWLPRAAGDGGIVTGRRRYVLDRPQGREHGLSRLMKPSRLKRVRNRVAERAGFGVAALAIVPRRSRSRRSSLASGAFGGSAWTFFTTLAAVRLVRSRRAAWPPSTAAVSSPGCNRRVRSDHRRAHRAGGDRTPWSGVAVYRSTRDHDDSVRSNQFPVSSSQFAVNWQLEADKHQIENRRIAATPP